MGSFNGINPMGASNEKNDIVPILRIDKNKKLNRN
jgi:hypothetical protein